jgi:hypothetical protein
MSLRAASSRDRGRYREAVGEFAAFLGTTLLLLLMMTQPEWEDPWVQVVWAASGLGLVGCGVFLMLGRRRGTLGNEPGSRPE